MCRPYLDIDLNRQTVQKIMAIKGQFNIWTVTITWNQGTTVLECDNGTFEISHCKPADGNTSTSIMLMYYRNNPVQCVDTIIVWFSLSFVCQSKQIYYCLWWVDFLLKNNTILPYL